ncbi:MAG TPA: hypothetical protein VLU92_05240 [Candidatus Dormibacteraeota bacterium]|nr:hypothetical protein [Candidatus Dormibacteraeota bacterium]
MGIGIAFTFFLIAALAAPFVWLAWWAAGSLGGDGGMKLSVTTAPAEVDPRAAAARSRFQGPRPADISLPRRPGAISMYSRDGQRELGTCSGPDHAGRCPRTPAGDPVPCAGLVLSLPRPVGGSTEWGVPPGYRTCLVGSYDAFRQPAAQRG